jgi:hypothetical protein
VLRLLTLAHQVLWVLAHPHQVGWVAKALTIFVILVLLFTQLRIVCPTGNVWLKYCNCVVQIEEFSASKYKNLLLLPK